MNDPILQQLNRKRRRRIWTVPLAFLTGAELTAIPVFLFQGHPLWLIPSALLFLEAVRQTVRRWESRMKTAQILDAETNAKNRMEAWFSLEQNHPLKAALEADTRSHYSTKKAGGFFHPFIILIAVLVLLTPLLVLQIVRRAQTHFSEVGKAEQNGKDSAPLPGKKEPEKEEIPELSLTEPEQEIRRKPLDEVNWQGAGRSGHGFRKVVLSVYVNGKKHSDLPAEKPSEKRGEVSFSGFLSLEDLDVRPFDLVSYHLTAECGGKTVFSTPQFIEIRPFREDAILADELMKFNFPGNRKEKLLQAYAAITIFMQTQLELNKLLFRITRSALDRNGTKDFQEQVRRLKKEQRELVSELDSFLKEEENRMLPADSINHLELALNRMKKALAEMERKYE